MQPTILITRPGPFAAEFADLLRARLGCKVPMVTSPLMKVENCGELFDLDAVSALIFTSRNGVDAYAATTRRRDILCICVGAATAQAARKQGLTAISCDGAADDLVARIVAESITGPCLHVRGEHGIGDVAARLSTAGIPTDEVVLYRQMPQPLSSEAVGLIRGDAPLILPLFSPRTARLLFERYEISARFDVAAMSDNVAAEVSDTGVNTVQVAEKPTVSAMLDATTELVAKANSLERGNLAQ